jgi:hypothetical protein
LAFRRGAGEEERESGRAGERETLNRASILVKYQFEMRDVSPALPFSWHFDSGECGWY